MMDDFANKLKFVDKEHRRFFDDTLFSVGVEPADVLVIYLLGLSEETRNLFTKVYSAENHALVFNEHDLLCMSSTAQKIVMLAANLTQRGLNSDILMPSELFASDLTEFFFCAIRYAIQNEEVITFV